jgi:effector-binding domain-containing protein
MKCVPEHEHKGIQVDIINDRQSNESSSRLREHVLPAGRVLATDYIPAHIGNLGQIHRRYKKVLAYMNANKSTLLAHALRH